MKKAVIAILATIVMIIVTVGLTMLEVYMRKKGLFWTPFVFISILAISICCYLFVSWITKDDTN